MLFCTVEAENLCLWEFKFVFTVKTPTPVSCYHQSNSLRFTPTWFSWEAARSCFSWCFWTSYIFSGFAFWLSLNIWTTFYTVTHGYQSIPPPSLLCFFTPHQFEVGATGTSVWAWASGGGPKNVLRRTELETKEAAMCEGPGQPSQLQKDMLKEVLSTPILCLYYSYFVKRKKKKN